MRDGFLFLCELVSTEVVFVEGDFLFGGLLLEGLDRPVVPALLLVEGDLLGQ